jgi:hypothetical protein
MVYEHIREERGFHNIRTEILESNLLDARMLITMGILVRVWYKDFYKYKYMVKQGIFACTVLPHVDCFDRLSNKWIIEQEEHEWELAPATPQDDAWPEEAPEPPYQQEFEEVHVSPQLEWYEPAPPKHEWYEHVPPHHDWHEPALPQQEWHAQPAPDAWEFAPAAPDYQLGEGSSSQWGNQGDSSHWGIQDPSTMMVQ